MQILLVFFIGFLISFVGVIPPGLLNMTAAKICVDEGKNRAIVFALGVCTVVAAQTLVGVLFAKFINEHPHLNSVLQKIALAIFTIVAIYFLTLSKKEQDVDLSQTAKSRKSHYAMGVFMALINVLPIPYHAFVSASIAGFGWFKFDQLNIANYVLGSMSGTFVALYSYVAIFRKYKRTKKDASIDMNRVIGIVMAAIAILTLVRILRAS